MEEALDMRLEIGVLVLGRGAVERVVALMGVGCIPLNKGMARRS